MIGYSLPAALGQLAIAFWFLGQTAGEPSMLLFGATKLAGLVSLALSAAIFASGLLALKSFKNEDQSSIATTIAASTGIVALVILAITIVISIMEFADDGIAHTVQQLIWVFVAGVVPLIAIVTGYWLRPDED